MSNPSGPPLAGVRVVELASYVTGPYAAALLADMGADVVKVEERTEGDALRNWAKGGYSAVFRSVNRGKRSIGVDVRTPAGREVLLALIDRADVFVENARPGVAERLGCGYETVSARNPRLVYCSVSGFGAHGPYRDRPGYDTVGQAMSGLLGLLTDFEDPRPMGVSLSDHVTGVFACYGILAALVGRAADGQGRHVETSLLRATTAFVAENAARFLDDGEVPTRSTRAHTAQAYAFVAGDGLPFVVHLSSPQKFWASLTRAIDRPELYEDPRFADRNRRVAHYDELHEVLAQTFAGAGRNEWLARLEAADVPAAPINRFDEVFADPGVQDLGLVHDVTHPTAGAMRLLGSAVEISGHDDATIGPPPLLGEQTEQILRELGYDAEAVTRLRAQEVI
ncbi:MAG TPA: CoA transferase [Candidatus Limnocylindrales bacterium]|jgi:formyl-CoA transferase